MNAKKLFCNNHTQFSEFIYFVIIDKMLENFEYVNFGEERVRGKIK